MKKIDCNMGRCAFCSSCSPAWLELTKLKKQTFLYRKGEQLFAEGKPVTGIYFMLSGAVKIHKKWGDEKDLIIRFATAGDILGIRGFGDVCYRATATALEHSEVCFIPSEHLKASFETNPGLSFKLMEVYAVELQKAEERMNNLAHMDVKGRVALTLKTLQEIFGQDEAGFLPVSISRQDIASYAGTTYETVFKIFSEWIAEGFIKTEGKRIQIRSRNF